VALVEVVAMTEPRGRVARWSAAVLAAPVAAGLFAGTTSWASAHDPRHPDGSVPQAGNAADPQLAALRDQLAADSATLQQLSAQVAAVRAQATALTGKPLRPVGGKAGAAVAGGAAGTGSSSSTRSSGGKASGSSSSGHSSSGSSSSHSGSGSGSSGSGGSTSSGSGGSGSGGGGSSPAPKPAPKPPPSPPPTQGGTGASGSG
jgi:hypothetical protein